MRTLVPLIVLGSLLPVSPVLGQAPNVVTRESTVTATVDRIEKVSRVVTFRTADNVFQSVYVEPAVKLFDELKTGDVVTVRYVESVVAEVRPGAKLTEVRDSTEEARKAGDQDVIQQLKMVVTIEDIDSQGLFVKYRTNDNRLVVQSVIDKKIIEGLRAGDRVEVTLTRARAVSIERGRR